MCGKHRKHGVRDAKHLLRRFVEDINAFRPARQSREDRVYEAAERVGIGLSEYEGITFKLFRYIFEFGIFRIGAGVAARDVEARKVGYEK